MDKMISFKRIHPVGVYALDSNDLAAAPDYFA